MKERIKTSRRRSASRIPPELLAPYVSATFVLVLNWWLDSGSSLSAVEVHDVFRSLVTAALTSR